jgi:hypothetical protein
LLELVEITAGTAVEQPALLAPEALLLALVLQAVVQLPLAAVQAGLLP